MKTKIRYIVDIDCYPYSEHSISDEFYVEVEPTLQDIVAYLFEKEYHKYYNELSWYLEPNAREFVKNIEMLYMKNQLDETSLSREMINSSFLKDKYRYLAEEYLEEEYDLEDIKEEIIRELADRVDVCAEIR